MRMRTSARSALPVLLAAASATSTGLAYALPIVGLQLTQRVSNSEFRGSTSTMRGFENQIWHFLPDGRVRAVAEARKIVWSDTEYRQEWRDDGAWRIVGDRVCVQFHGPNQDVAGCYTVDAREGIHVRLIGPYIWEGTLERNR
jgi:hypothetical protein